MIKITDIFLLQAERRRLQAEAAEKRRVEGESRWISLPDFSIFEIFEILSVNEEVCMS